MCKQNEHNSHIFGNQWLVFTAIIEGCPYQKLYFESMSLFSGQGGGRKQIQTSRILTFTQKKYVLAGPGNKSLGIVISADILPK